MEVAQQDTCYMPCQIASEMRKYYIFLSVGKTLINEDCLFSLAKLNLRVKIKTKNSKWLTLWCSITRNPKIFSSQRSDEVSITGRDVYELSLRSHNHVTLLLAVCFNLYDNVHEYVSVIIMMFLNSLPKFRIKLKKCIQKVLSLQINTK
jgi:hypothetical protein